jgi:hypothetical protein
MQHQEVDPSLCAAEPPAQTLDDGFSPPDDAPAAQAPASDEAGEGALSPKSPF